MFRRGALFYCEDRTNGQQKSLRTRNESEARRILQAKNDAVNQPLMNLVMAKTYLAAQDPTLITRTWADVMQVFCERGKPSTRIPGNTPYRYGNPCWMAPAPPLDLNFFQNPEGKGLSLTPTPCGATHSNGDTP